MYYFRKDLKDKTAVKVEVPHKKIMMCLNESPFDPLKPIRKKFLKKMKTVHLNRYFNKVTGELATALAEYTGVTEDMLAFGNGADEMLYYLFTAIKENNDSYIASLAPSYFDYKSYSAAVGLNIKFLSLDKNFDFDTDKFLELAAQDDCKMLIICNPNNPTGNLFDAKKIEYIIRNTDKPVLLDEVYYEFSQKTFVKKLKQYTNLIILRSFSKSFSAAGLRFGYILSNPQNIIEIKKVITAFNLNLMTQTFALTMLENKKHFLKIVKKIKKYKKKMYRKLRKLPGITVKNTDTNFLIFKYRENSKPLFQYLQKKDIAIRAVWNHIVLSNYLRVTISSKEDNKIFLDRVEEFIQTTEGGSNGK